MNANEYFENSKAEEIPKKAAEMYLEMLNEYSDTKKTRDVRTTAGLISIIEEINEKWNIVMDKIYYKFGKKLAAKNFIWNDLLAKNFPEKFETRSEVV